MYLRFSHEFFHLKTLSLLPFVRLVGAHVGNISASVSAASEEMKMLRSESDVNFSPLFAFHKEFHEHLELLLFNPSGVCAVSWSRVLTISCGG